jgi:hypothetical protein
LDGFGAVLGPDKNQKIFKAPILYYVKRLIIRFTSHTFSILHYVKYKAILLATNISDLGQVLRFKFCKTQNFK